MAGSIDRATLDRLIALGRKRGELNAEEFQAALHIDSTDVDALVLERIPTKRTPVRRESAR